MTVPRGRPGSAGPEAHHLADGIALRLLADSDADEVAALLRRNREHLNRNGWTIPDGYGAEDWLREGEESGLKRLRYGITSTGGLVGMAAITNVFDRTWSVGYFVEEGHTGRGLATTACGKLCEIAAGLGAAELYAVVFHGNTASERVLAKNAFQCIQATRTSTRWWRPLVADVAPAMLVDVVHEQPAHDDDGTEQVVQILGVSFAHTFDDGVVNAAVPTTGFVPCALAFYVRRGPKPLGTLTPIPTAAGPFESLPEAVAWAETEYSLG